jgi:small subunit ribosomal protein S17
MSNKKFQGTVISDKMEQTIVVQVNRTRIHPLYHKRYTRSKKYKVHDSEGKAKTGDQVIFTECRPLSKEKKWRLIEIVSKG